MESSELRKLFPVVSSYSENRKHSINVLSVVFEVAYSHLSRPSWSSHFKTEFMEFASPYFLLGGCLHRGRVIAVQCTNNASTLYGHF